MILSFSALPIELIKKHLVIYLSIYQQVILSRVEKYLYNTIHIPTKLLMILAQINAESGNFRNMFTDCGSTKWYYEFGTGKYGRDHQLNCFLTSFDKGCPPYKPLLRIYSTSKKRLEAAKEFLYTFEDKPITLPPDHSPVKVNHPKRYMTIVEFTEFLIKLQKILSKKTYMTIIYKELLIVSKQFTSITNDNIADCCLRVLL